MRGFGKFKKIIENKTISKNFDDVRKLSLKIIKTFQFVTSHMNAKTGIKTSLEKLHSFDEMINEKLSSLPFELDDILFKQK